jgi:hypothetical protein
MPGLLHVTNGESAGNTLRQARLGGEVLSWQDVLHEGPVPAGSRARLLQTRASFLAECGWGSRSALLSSLERRDRQVLLPAPPPLGDGGVYAQLELRLTDDGERVLRGEADRVELLGIDRWLGGTHVTPRNLWRWDAAERRLVS